MRHATALATAYLAERRAAMTQLYYAGPAGQATLNLAPVRPTPPVPDFTLQPPPPPARRVLVIDDDAALQALLAEVLVDEGFGLLQTTNGRDGLRLARDHQPHVILLDLQLPGIPGYDLLRTLHADPDTRDIPVVVMSAAPEVLLAHEVRAAAEVLRKPFDLDDLVTCVRRLAARRARAVAG